MFEKHDESMRNMRTCHVWTPAPPQNHLIILLNLEELRWSGSEIKTESGPRWIHQPGFLTHQVNLTKTENPARLILEDWTVMTSHPEVTECRMSMTNPRQTFLNPVRFGFNSLKWIDWWNRSNLCELESLHEVLIRGLKTVRVWVRSARHVLTLCSSFWFLFPNCWTHTERDWNYISSP